MIVVASIFETPNTCFDPRHDGLNAAKKAMIDTALRATDGNHVEAAALLDIHVTYLYRLINNLYRKG